MNNKYLEEIIKLIKKIDTDETALIEKAAAVIAQTIEKGGIVHSFGAGHSSSIAIEGFHRSGSFACNNAILVPAMSFHKGGATASTMQERLEGVMLDVLDTHKIGKDDSLIAVSNSGRNPAVIETAMYFKNLGVKVIVITAYEGHKNSPSRHSNGKKLTDFADIIIDNYADKEECVLEGFDGKKTGPSSTITGAAIINAIYVKAIDILLAKGIKPDVYTSGNNIGDDTNKILEDKYKSRIKFL